MRPAADRQCGQSSASGPPHTVIVLLSPILAGLQKFRNRVPQLVAVCGLVHSRNPAIGQLSRRAGAVVKVHLGCGCRLVMDPFCCPGPETSARKNTYMGLTYVPQCPDTEPSPGHERGCLA